MYKAQLVPNMRWLPLIASIALIRTDTYSNVICYFTFILWCVWGLLFVTCQPIIPCPTALLIELSLDVASSCCRMGMWLALTLPQPTSHCITAPGCVGFFTSPVSETYHQLITVNILFSVLFVTKWKIVLNVQSETIRVTFILNQKKEFIWYRYDWYDISLFLSGPIQYARTGQMLHFKEIFSVFAW